MRHEQGTPSSKGKVRSAIRMLIPLHKQIEAIDILSSVSTRVRYEPSCICSRIYRDVDEVRAIILEELWTNQEDILHHLQSEAYQRVLLVIEMAEEPPEIRFDTIDSSSGLETIANARMQTCE